MAARRPIYRLLLYYSMLYYFLDQLAVLLTTTPPSTRSWSCPTAAATHLPTIASYQTCPDVSYTLLSYTRPARWMEAGGQTGVRADDRNDDNIDNGFINNKHKPQRRYGSNVCKCQISSQTNRYRYKFKSNQIFFPKLLNWSPQAVCQVSSL